MSTYSQEPVRRVINTEDARLNRILLREDQHATFASISEYAQHTGIDTADIIELFGTYLDEESVALEFVRDEIFLLTAPHGRPMRPGLAEVTPNLWELLRRRSDLEQAYLLWRLVRNLERSGWQVQTNLSRIMFGMAQVSELPLLGVDVGNSTVPLIIFPAADALSSPVGILNDYNRAGAAAVAIVCDNGALDEMVTAVRKWVLSHTVLAPSLSVLVLEAPRYNPTLLSPQDAAVSARDVTVQMVHSLDWTPSAPPPTPVENTAYGQYVQ
jgi:hypothetical protein